MNNKLVAWMHKEATSWVSTFIHPETEPDEWLPLYTHPAKELTDEEILSLTGFKENPYDIFIEYEKEDLIEFARAILRKAQENG